MTRLSPVQLMAFANLVFPLICIGIWPILIKTGARNPAFLASVALIALLNLRGITISEGKMRRGFIALLIANLLCAFLFGSISLLRSLLMFVEML